MPDTRNVRCEECDESALEYDPDGTSAEWLEGKYMTCESCSVLGKVILREPDDEWFRAYLIFRRCTDKELAELGVDDDSVSDERGPDTLRGQGQG